MYLIVAFVCISLIMVLRICSCAYLPFMDFGEMPIHISRRELVLLYFFPADCQMPFDIPVSLYILIDTCSD